MENVQVSVEPLNRLLRGELSAVETYQQALAAIKDTEAQQELRRISDEHNEAVGVLRQHIRDYGGIPDESSGAWGVWAKTFEGAARIFGETTALKALKEGEEHGLKEYDEVIDNPDLLPRHRLVLADKFRSRQAEHIATLERCIGRLH